MIDALPDVSELEDMDNDELSKVHDKAQDAVDAYEALTEDAQAQLSADVEKLADLLEYMAGLTMTAATEAKPLGKLDYIKYSDGVSQYFTYNNRLYRITYTNMSDAKTITITISARQSLWIETNKGLNYTTLFIDGRAAIPSDLPTTQGDEFICYAMGKEKVGTITCLELNNSPTWKWASDAFSASVVFTAKNYDVCNGQCGCDKYHYFG